MEQNNKADFSPLITTKQAATLLALPENTVYEHARTGLLPTVRIGRLVRFRKDDLDIFCKNGGKALAGGWKHE